MLENALDDHGMSGHAARAILGRHLNWLFYFGEQWLLAHVGNLFPKYDQALRNAAWVAHVMSDLHPVPQLTSALHDIYAEHIAALGGDDPPRSAGMTAAIGSSTI